MKLQSEMLEGPRAFTAFKDAMRKIVSVPRTEFLKREAEYKRQADANPRKRGPKKKVHHNSIYVATEEGIKMVFNSQDNEMKANQISNTKIGVLAAAGVKENLIRGNKSLLNTVDMRDDNFNPACGTEDWIRNIFTVANQFCVH